MNPTTVAFLLFVTAACASKSFLPSQQDPRVTPVISQGAETGAQNVAASFYSEVRRERIEGLPTAAQLKRLKPYLAPELVQAFKHASAEQEAFMRKNPDEKPPFIEGDLFSSLFEGVTTWKLDTAQIIGSKAEVPVQLSYSSDGQTSRWNDTLVLRKNPEGWVVTDIRMGGQWAFKAGGNSLAETLSAKP